MTVVRTDWKFLTKMMNHTHWKEPLEDIWSNSIAQAVPHRIAC